MSEIKVGDTVRVVGLPEEYAGRWSAPLLNNGDTIVVEDISPGDPKIRDKFQGSDQIVIFDNGVCWIFLSWVEPLGKTHKCHCPRDVWMYQGCQCGGV